MYFIFLGVLALGLTIAMFTTRNSMLGFPSGIFWGILGGYAYQQSVTTWDWQYLIFFASMGMLIFTIFAAFGLRKSDLAGPDADKGAFIDEGGPRDGPFIDENSPRRPRRPGGAEVASPIPVSASWGDIDRLGMNDMEDPLAARSEASRRIRERAARRRSDGVYRRLRF